TNLRSRSALRQSTQRSSSAARSTSRAGIVTGSDSSFVDRIDLALTRLKLCHERGDVAASRDCCGHVRHLAREPLANEPAPKGHAVSSIVNEADDKIPPRNDQAYASRADRDPGLRAVHGPIARTPRLCRLAHEHSPVRQRRTLLPDRVDVRAVQKIAGADRTC